MLKMYGIKHCDTMKKAFAWLAATGIDYEFHDYKKSGVQAKDLQRWEQTLGWETLLNRRGTTWRKLSEADQKNINREHALRLMQEQPTLIKRPLMDTGTQLWCGFSIDEWTQKLKTL